MHLELTNKLTIVTQATNRNPLKFRIKKTPGYDEIPAELWKASSETGIRIMHQLCKTRRTEGLENQIMNGEKRTRQVQHAVDPRNQGQLMNNLHRGKKTREES